MKVRFIKGNCGVRTYSVLKIHGGYIGYVSASGTGSNTMWNAIDMDGKIHIGFPRRIDAANFLAAWSK